MPRRGGDQASRRAADQDELSTEAGLTTQPSRVRFAACGALDCCFCPAHRWIDPGLRDPGSPVRLSTDHFGQTSGYNHHMTSVPLGEAKNRLSEFIADVERTHDRVLITRHGHPAAVLISPEDLAALEETVDILTTAGAPEAIAEGLADLDAGRIADNDTLRARFNSR